MQRLLIQKHLRKFLFFFNSLTTRFDFKQSKRPVYGVKLLMTEETPPLNKVCQKTLNIFAKEAQGKNKNVDVMRKPHIWLPANSTHLTLTDST